MSLPRCSMSTKMCSVHAPLPLVPGALKMDLSLAVADSSWNQLDVDAFLPLGSILPPKKRIGIDMK